MTRALPAILVVLVGCECGLYEVDDAGEVQDNVEIEMMSEGFLWDEWDMEIQAELEEGGPDWVNLVFFLGPCELPQIRLSQLSKQGQFETMEYFKMSGCPAAHDDPVPIEGVMLVGTINYEWNRESLTVTFEDVSVTSDTPSADLPSITSIQLNGSYVAELRRAPCAM